MTSMYLVCYVPSVFYCTLSLCVKPLTTAGLLCARQAVADLYSSLGEEVSPEVSVSPTACKTGGHWLLSND